MMRFLLIGALLTQSALALEPWADASVPVKDGLEVWLDAAAQVNARTATGLRAFPANGAVDVWLDGAGMKRDVRQPVRSARPQFVSSPGGAFIRFDGKDDFLFSAPGASMKGATVLIVAAPRSNPGQFRGFFGMNRTGRNDYQTGLNLDLGGNGSATLSWLNAEGAGATGEQGLLETHFDFGTFHLFTLVADNSSLRLFADGEPQKSRERRAGDVGMDELTVGGRCCSNEGGPAFAQSFLEGDIAELLVYNRPLSEPERGQIEKYLFEKHNGLRAPDVADSRPLVPVPNPPLVQMLIPGFSARELPLKLTNIDCLRYRADGKLIAGAYNGKIWILSDSDGDGLEDKADLYWESKDLKNVIGMDVTRPDDPRGAGVFVATAGRILFIPDLDGNGRGDKEIVVADGWEKQASPGGGGSVDALGLTLGPDGSIYFGLGVSAYNNAYLLDESGKSHFDLKTERGTILRIAPDFSKREVVCTGIRYPVGAAFNRFGDLFVTEQEGATWLPNGNPFDELLHIQSGRHYGFPPQHPRHLPDVIDEPSVFDYAPQHQSACGLAFNDGARIFGPDSWRGDAFVTGESRGKLWRTKLVKTSEGYVAQNHLLACLSMLAVDVALSPRGDLILACHSGSPDWGSGPNGAGKLFRISQDPTPPALPVLAWSARPDEIQVAFDREVDPVQLRQLAKGVEVTAGRYVSAGDRFESFRPGYQVVKDQMAAKRRAVPVLGTNLSLDRRTLNLTVPIMNSAVPCAITLPDFLASDRRPADGTISRLPQIDIATDLNGVEAEWTADAGGEKWQGWLPHVDLNVSRELTVGSAEHERLWKLLQQRGTLTMRGQLNLWEMLQPAIQPGARLDYDRPFEKVMVEFSSNLGFVFREISNPAGSGTGAGKVPGAPISQRIELPYEPKEGVWPKFEIQIPTGSRPMIRVTWRTSRDPRPRAFPLRRILVPWAKPDAANPGEPAGIAAELNGGNWLRGRELFSGKAQCARCHMIHGTGGHVGPDLSNLAFRDLASVERDIREPSAALNPDHLTYHVVKSDGTELAAVMLTEDKETVRLADATGSVQNVPRTSIKSMDALPVSLMPPGLIESLTPAERKDLLFFLLSPQPLEPAPIEAKDPPAPRTRAELEAVLGVAKPVAAENAKSHSPMRILLVAAKKDHGPGEHDYPLWQRRWQKLLGLADGVSVRTAQDWPTVDDFAKSDVIVFYSNNPSWTPERKPELERFLERGGGAVFIHWAIEGHDFANDLADCIGIASYQKETKYRHGEMTMTFPKPEHPITRGFQTTRFVDETYWQLVGDPARVLLLGEAQEEGAARPQMWVCEHGKGRVFVSIPGHYTWTFDDPLHRVLILRGICWAAQQPVDRLVELATVGCRMQ